MRLCVFFVNIIGVFLSLLFLTMFVLASCWTILSFKDFSIFFFYLGFHSRTFTNHRTAGEEGGHFSSLPLPPALQALTALLQGAHLCI